VVLVRRVEATMAAEDVEALEGATDDDLGGKNGRKEEGGRREKGGGRRRREKGEGRGDTLWRSLTGSGTPFDNSDEPAGG
jgi:hypothetical protein